MNNQTTFRIGRPTHDVFEAFVDPVKIGNFWFTSSSERWEAGKTITMKYEEYNALVDIRVTEIVVNRKIVFQWGENEDEHEVTITLKELDHASTIIEVNEEGFKENDEALLSKLVDNKEGWVFMLTCLKAYLECGVTQLRTGIVK
ncbi:SRPBCC family protein [Brevibacillus sp. NRS-1366]|uniref:SRPBCC family protein n=1 Tax=Brevibacillus sp. NRS-1366 TaxID=3233899 RepID=UPI003D242FD3